MYEVDVGVGTFVSSPETSVASFLFVADDLISKRRLSWMKKITRLFF